MLDIYIYICIYIYTYVHISTCICLYMYALVVIHVELGPSAGLAQLLPGHRRSNPTCCNINFTFVY